MIEIDSFRGAIESVRGNATVSLTRDGAGVVARTGRLARWIRNFRTSENRETVGRFIQSLRREYGRDLSDDLIRSSGLDRVQTRGKPLRARQVEQVVENAEALRADVRTRNARMAASWSDPVAVGAGVSFLDIKIGHEARKRFPMNPTVAQLVNADRIATRARQAIVEAGRDGTRLVTNEQAADIAAGLVRAELITAYETARDHAYEMLSLENPDSLANRALTAIAATREPPLNLDPGRMSFDARKQLTSRLQASVVDGETPAHRLVHEASLQALANKVIGEFVAERVAARDAVAALPIVNAEEKAAFLDQVLHDDVPRQLVPAMGLAYVIVADDVAALGTSLETRDVQEKIGWIRQHMSEAFLEASFNVTTENQDAVFRSFWRFLLTPLGMGQTEAIAETLRPASSPMRAMGEAALWYRADFRGSEEADQTFRSEKTGNESLAFFPEESFQDATRIAVMIGALMDVASERAGWPATELLLGINEKPTDETIVALRNLGIPIPAPNRLGEDNPSVPISEPAMQAIRKELTDHMQSLGGGALKNGLLEESTVDFERGTYRFEGTTLPASEAAITAKFHEFCTDPESGLNHKMLKNLSMVAYQAGLGCMYATVLNPERPDLGFVDSSLMLATGRREYNISRNERGDVLVSCVRSGNVSHMHKLEEDDSPTDPVEVDPSRSHLRAAITFRIDAVTCEPSVDGVDIAYSLSPPPGSPESATDPVGPESEDDDELLASLARLRDV